MANLMQFATLARNAHALSTGIGGSRVPGLPAASGSPLAARSPGIGSTTTDLAVPADITSVSNQPSMQMVRLEGGAMATLIRRRTRYMGILDERDLDGIKRLATQMIERMVAHSQGSLTLRELARRGHPYGRNAQGRMRGKLGRGLGSVKGARGSVPNLSIVNRQSGAYAQAWEADVALDPGGVTISLINTAPYSSFLSFGTVKMQAHSPATLVPVMMLSQLNSEWQKALSVAYRRKTIEAQMAQAVGGAS